MSFTSLFDSIEIVHHLLIVSSIFWIDFEEFIVTVQFGFLLGGETGGTCSLLDINAQLIALIQKKFSPD